MQLGLTVIDVRDGGERPVEVRAEPHHTLADLLHALALPADDPVHVDGAVCSPEAPVGLPPLLDGASMVLGRPPSTPGTAPGRAPLRVTTTTGPDAGRSLDLTRGRHVIAPRSSHLVPLTEPDVIADAVRAVVADSTP